MMTKHRQGRASSAILDEVMRDDKKTLPDWMLAFQPLNYVRGCQRPRYASTKKKYADVFEQPMKHRPALLAALKTMLAAGRARLKKTFLQNNDGAMYLGLHTLLMDDVVRLIYDSACRIYGADMRLAVLATGGYGRGELCPHSDLDILFLTKVKPKRHEAEAISFMLYLLWDLGLNVGHASRSLRQALRAAGDDLTIRTALLESRHVVGDTDLSAELMAMFRAEITPAKAKNFIAEKLAERDARHARSDTRRYMLEPNIKTGKGGLRDLQTLFWIARYGFGVDHIAALIEKGFLTTAEARRFSMAQQFLWSLRCHLHFRCGREDDRLSFDAQMDIAPLFGFRARGGQKGVEAFMRRYFLAATSVGNLTRIFCGAIADELAPVSAPVPVQESVRVQARAPVPFLLCGRHLLFDPNEKISEHPNALLDVFLLALEKNYEIHPRTLQKITRKLRLIDDAFRADAEANATFLAILTHKKNPERILRLMNEVGILGKFLPDFGRIVAMMQFNMYHSYTVDEHTIYALGVLHQIEAGALVDIAPVASNAVGKISERTALYVAVLLHDIAKGHARRGGDDHSTLGAAVARRLCPRLGLDDAAVETVAWLVQNHLLMSETAFRYDLNDAATIDRFAQIVQSPERLNLLLVLTVADIRAVGPHVWNGFKAGLMRELYARTLAVLVGDAVVSSGQQDALRQALTGRDAYWDAARVQAHIDMFYPNYWSHFDLDAYLRHADMCREYSVADTRTAKSIGINIMPDHARNATEIAVLVTDHAGVLARLAGGVAASGANIVDARVISRKDGLALDVLWVQDATRQAITDRGALARLHTNIEKSMFGHLDIDTAMRARLRATPARMRRIAAPSRVLINNQISPTHTVIEINGKDAPGLLYRLTGALAEMGVQIQMASVSTYGNRVVDVFYVKDSFGLKLEAKARIKALEAVLLKIVADSDPSKRVAA